MRRLIRDTRRGGDEVPTAFQAIFLDLHMPGMMGFSSVKAIKQKAPGNPIPVFTGDDRSSVNDLFGAGVGGVVS